MTGTGTSPQLVGLVDNGALIVLAVGTTSGDQAALTVTNVTIDISTKDGVEFPYVATNAATLVLKGGTSTLGALKLGAGTVTNAYVYLTCTNSVTISGSAPVLKGASDSDGAVAGLVSGGAASPANDATITGQTSTNNVTVIAGGTLASRVKARSFGKRSGIGPLRLYTEKEMRYAEHEIPHTASY
jgi:hypothetical protein